MENSTNSFDPKVCALNLFSYLEISRDRPKAVKYLPNLFLGLALKFGNLRMYSHPFLYL